MEVKTVHYVAWQYLFNDNIDYNNPYRTETIDRLSSHVKSVLSRYPNVYENTSFCCQAEGFEIYSEDLQSLMIAANSVNMYFCLVENITKI